MTGSPISRLPPEVLHQILDYLPISTLLRFGRTSRSNYSAAISALQHLRLAIFPKETQCMLVSITSAGFTDDDPDVGDAFYDNAGLNWVKITAPLPPVDRPSRSKVRHQGHVPPDPAIYREKLFQLHNALAYSILSTPTLASLRYLAIHIYHIDSLALTKVLATQLPSLRDLQLNLHHPYLHDPCLPGGYWTNPAHLQPSKIWDVFGGLRLQQSSDLKLRKLERLTIQRAGISNLQLQKWIECNPNLAELRLRHVAGVDQDFVQWMGRYYHIPRSRTSDITSPRRLQVLALENCAALVLNNIDHFTWLDSLFDVDSKRPCDPYVSPVLHTLSLKHSRSVCTPVMCDYLESRKPSIRRITLPQGSTLVPRQHKRSLSDSSNCPTSSNKGKKRPRARTAQFFPRTSGIDSADEDSGIEADTSELDMQTLILTDMSNDDEEDDKSSPKSPVPYLRIETPHGFGKQCRSMANNIIEPDPNAI
jgi:hypothetical protein